MIALRNRDIPVVGYTQKMRCLITIFLFFVATSNFAKEPVFLWADDQDYPPYIYLESQEQASGIFNDIMNAVFSEMNIPLNVKLYPWKRAQWIVKEARADGLVTIPTTNRLKYLVATQPLVHIDLKVHFNKVNSKSKQLSEIHALDHLRPYSIIEYQGNGWAEGRLKGFNVTWAPNYSSAVWMVAANNGDLFLDDPISAKFHINKQIKLNPEMATKLNLISHGDFTLHSAPYSLLIRKDSAFSAIVPEFNAAQKKIKENGKYEEIIGKYIGSVN